MLSRFEGKNIRITTSDGEVFTGVAKAFPSGWGLHVFDREEESVLLEDTHIFLSQIERIEELSPEKRREPSAGHYYDVIEELLEQPYLIADILPRQVEKDAAGQYFAVDRFFRQPEQMEQIHRKMALALLRLNCYFDMAVSFDNCESWRLNPDPKDFADSLAALSGNTFMRAVFEEQKVMIDAEPGDTWLTVYGGDPKTKELIKACVAAEGFFTWIPSQ